MLGLATLALALSIAVASAAAEAQSRAVDEALEALESGRFDRADALLARAITDGSASRGDLARAYLYRGFLDDARGRTEESRQALALAVALEPAIEPARMMGPSVREQLESAKRARQEHHIALTLEAEGARVRVSTHDTPEALLGSVEVWASGGDSEPAFRRTLTPPGGWSVTLPDTVVGDAGVMLSAELRTPTGVVLETASVAIDPPVALSLDSVPPERQDAARRSVFENGWFWAAIGIVVAGAAATAIALWATADVDYVVQPVAR